MNLHGIVHSAIGAVNPHVAATMKVSTGSITNPDGSRTPTYTIVTGDAQVQPLTFKDLTQVDGLNLNGSARAIYFFGVFNGVVRPAQKGGDTIALTDGPNVGTWLIVQVLEQWSGWCKVAVVLQNS
ncbi:hypothetical protein BFS86_19420 [Shewanella algae]|nr:hypothetical protein BFS86_19420 [Shewanella algae]DAU40263.1 MAG TPA: head closure knob [Caudoviricetes sp.]